MRTIAATWAVILSAALAGCGGGGDGGTPASCGTMLHPDPCATTSAAASTSTTTATSIRFVSADTTNIALKGTGGVGRQEFSTLTFDVRDVNGHTLAGVAVDFSLSAIAVGGITLTPTSAITGADGTVTTMVASGTIPTSARVVAVVHGSTPAVTTLSNVLVVSTGVPDQQHFSLATQTGNCEGGDFDQTCSIVTATLGDHFGNPVPDGTAVNFTTEGGIIDASCVTGSLPPADATPSGQTTNSKVGPGSGTCSVVLRASNPRPADGRVTVLAYALGEEDFVDGNGNNVFDAGDTFIDKSPDIFRNDVESGVTLANSNGTWTNGEPCIGLNNIPPFNCATPGDGNYNGVLGGTSSTLYVSRQLVQVFSGSAAQITFIPSALVCTAGQSVDVQVRVTDAVGNVMPAGTSISFSAQFGASAGTVNPSSLKVGNIVHVLGDQPLFTPLSPYVTTVTCPSPAGSGRLFATVTTPNGVISTANIPVN